MTLRLQVIQTCGLVYLGMSCQILLLMVHITAFHILFIFLPIVSQTPQAMYPQVDVWFEKGGFSLLFVTLLEGRISGKYRLQLPPRLRSGRVRDAFARLNRWIPNFRWFLKKSHRYTNSHYGSSQKISWLLLRIVLTPYYTGVWDLKAANVEFPLFSGWWSFHFPNADSSGRQTHEVGDIACHHYLAQMQYFNKFCLN